MSQHSSRREFLKRSALAGAGFWVAGTCAAAQSRSPNEKLNIGIIGVHSRGAANMASVASENIAALCDVDSTYLAEAAKKYPKAKTYADAAVQLIKDKGIAATPHVVEGTAYEVIPELAKALGAQVIVVGSHGRTGMGRLLLGSVAEKIIGFASCPVLVARA